MLEVIGEHGAEAATPLQAALDAARGKVVPEVIAAPPARQPPGLPTGRSDELQLAVFGLADDLDLPPRRVRRPLTRPFERLRAANLTLDAALQQLEDLIAELRY